MSLSGTRLPTATMSLTGGELCWNSPQYSIFRKKPLMRMRRNPSKRSLLLNAIPVSTDPGLSPSMGSMMSPTSHRSSWSSMSELEQPLSHVSLGQGVKIDQLIKVNEAIGIELADLESGKERWLEKLKLLEARICSNIVNIDKWATENKKKPVNIQAVQSGIVGDKKLKEDTPLPWRLSLEDLAFVFKSSNAEHGNKSFTQHQGKGSYTCTAAKEPLLANCALDIVVSSPKERDLPQIYAKFTPGHFYEAPGVVSKEGKIFVPKGANDGGESGNGLWKAGVTVDVESVSRAANTSTGRVRPSEDHEGGLALYDKSLNFTDLEPMLEGILESKTVEGRVGNSGSVEVVSLEEQGTDGGNQYTEDTLSMESHSEMVFSEAKLYNALIKARKQLQQLKQHTVTSEKVNTNLESTLRDSKHALEEAKLGADNLRSQNEQLQGMLIDCKTSFESQQLALLKEKDVKEQKLLCSMQSLEEIQQNAMVLERQKLVLESELNHFREAFEKSKQETVRLRKEKAAIELDFTGCKQTLKEAQDSAVRLQKERDNLDTKCSEFKEILEKSQHRYLILEKAKDDLQGSLTESKHAFKKAVDKNSITERERNNLEAANEALMNKLEKSEQHALMQENENSVLETVLVELKHTLEGTQQQVIVLEGERDYLKSELSEYKQAFEEERQHAFSLEEKKVALEIRFCEYKQVSMQSLEEIQQSAMVLERQKLVLESELNHFREAFEKAKQETVRLRKEKAAIELDFTGCKQTHKEAGDSAVRLQKERDNLDTKCSEFKEILEKIQHRYLMLEKAKDDLHGSLTESKHAFKKAVDKISITERGRNNLEAANEALMNKLEKTEQHAMMQENANSVLETVLVEVKHTLEGTQQQVIVLEGERDYLKSELSEFKQAFEEARQRAFSLEEEKVALEIGSCEYKQVIEETENHVLTLQSALEGTLQRADAMDHQVQRLRIEAKRLGEDNENLRALKHEKEIKCRDLEAQREVLRTEVESIKSKQEAAEEGLTTVNFLYVSAIEGIEKEKDHIQALQHQQLLLEEENASLKVSLENTMQMSKFLEAEQKRLQMKLNDAECSLQKAIQGLDVLSAEHANDVAALKFENAANECQIQELIEQVKEKTVELERLCQVETNFHTVSEKLNSQDSLLRSTSELESVKLGLAGKQIEIEDERSSKNTIIQELDAKMIKLKDLEKDLGIVRGAMKDEMVKKELIQKRHAEQTHSKELEATLESAKLEQNHRLVHLEDERMAKEAKLEELEAIKGHSDLGNLQAEVQVVWERENEDKETVLHEELSGCRELEEALQSKSAEQEVTNVAWEGERIMNESLLRELEHERRQRVQLEEQLKASKVKEEYTGIALQDERAALENLRKHIDTQEARCRELETALNLARIEQERREQEQMSKRAIKRNSCLEQEPFKVMKDDKGIHAISEIERLSFDVSELLAKSKKLEQMLSTSERESSCSSSNDAVRSAVTQEVRELHSRVHSIESRLADAGHSMRDPGKGKKKNVQRIELRLVGCDTEKGKEKEKKNEDELLALLEESSTFEPRPPGLEAHIAQNCNPSIDVTRQAEEEIRRLKESTETFHQALLDAHHTAISDVAGLLVELKSLKHLLNDKTMVASDRKEEKKRANLSIPTAALSTSALAAIGLLALLKFPKSTIS